MIHPEDRYAAIVAWQKSYDAFARKVDPKAYDAYWANVNAQLKRD